MTQSDPLLSDISFNDMLDNNIADILHLDADPSDIIDLNDILIKAAEDDEMNQMVDSTSNRMQEVNYGASTSSQIPPQQTENDKSRTYDDVAHYKTAASNLPPAKTKSSSVKAATTSTTHEKGKLTERKRKSDEPILDSNSNRKKPRLNINDCLAKVELPFYFSCCSRMIGQRLEFIMQHILLKKCLVYQDICDYFHASFNRDLVAAETQNLRWKENHNSLMSQYNQLQTDYETYSRNMNAACDELKKTSKKQKENCSDLREKMKVLEDKKNEEIKELKIEMTKNQEIFDEKRRNFEKKHQDQQRQVAEAQDIVDQMLKQHSKERTLYNDNLKLKEDKLFILQGQIDDLTKEKDKLEKQSFQLMIDHMQKKVEELKAEKSVCARKKKDGGGD